MADPASSFSSMAARGRAQDAASIGVGMIGYAFMGKAHAHAYRSLTYMSWPPPLIPRLEMISGRDAEALAEAARRFGFAKHVTDWREVIADDTVEVVDNSAPNNLHAEPVLAASRAGKHVICEKPLGMTAAESHDMWRGAEEAGITHMCAFNYRFVPAIRLAREMLEAGELGEIHHFRAQYLQDWIADPAVPMVWRLDRETAGSGALGDLGTHIIDIAHYLVGDFNDVSGTTTTFIKHRTGGDVTVDDAFEAAVTFANGAVGSIEASRFAPGRKNSMSWEINGSKGSMAFNLERLNELELFLSASRPGESSQGFRRVLVSEPNHPFWDRWWPPGHMLGWEHTFVHELDHFLAAIRNRTTVTPHGADFRDGYRASVVADAIARSGQEGRRIAVEYDRL